MKWQGYSHLHDTWDKYEYLKRFKGFKRVENYIKGPFAIQRRILADPATSREDLEALQIEKERQAEQLEGYQQVERIIAERNAPANADIPHEHRQLPQLCACSCNLPGLPGSAWSNVLTPPRPAPQSSTCASGRD